MINFVSLSLFALPYLWLYTFRLQLLSQLSESPSVSPQLQSIQEQCPLKQVPQIPKHPHDASNQLELLEGNKK